MPDTAIGYATIRAQSGHGVPVFVLALRANGRFVEWRGCGASCPPLVIAGDVADAIRGMRQVYAAPQFDLHLYPLRSPDERAAAISAGVLNEETGTLEPSELAASRLARAHCVSCGAPRCTKGPGDECGICYGLRAAGGGA